MCHSCWWSHPIVEVTPAMRAAAATVAALYERHPTGGAMHAVTDDFNVEDDLRVWTGGLAIYDRPFDDTEQACYEALRPLSEDERAGALALWEGWYEPQGLSVEEVTAEHLVAGRAEIAWTLGRDHVAGVDRVGVPFCSCGRRWPDADGEDAVNVWSEHC